MQRPWKWIWRAARSSAAQESIDLTTAREFELLEYLPSSIKARLSPARCSRARLEGIRSATLRLDNVIDVHMVRLRHKIDEGFPTKLLHTVRGVGFVLKGESQ